MGGRLKLFGPSGIGAEKTCHFGKRSLLRGLDIHNVFPGTVSMASAVEMGQSVCQYERQTCEPALSLGFVWMEIEAAMPTIRTFG